MLWGICVDTPCMSSQSMFCLCCYLYVQDAHPHVWKLPYVWMHPHIVWQSMLYLWVMFGCPLYIHNTKKACYVTLRGYPYAPIHMDDPICVNAPYMLGCPNMSGWPPVYGGTSKHLDTPWGIACIPCLVAFKHMFGMPNCMGACPHVWVALLAHPLQPADKVWMPPVSSDAPICMDTTHMFGMPNICVDAPSVCLNAPICLDTSLYVWMAPYV